MFSHQEFVNTKTWYKQETRVDLISQNDCQTITHIMVNKFDSNDPKKKKKTLNFEY